VASAEKVSLASSASSSSSLVMGREWDNQNLVLEQTKETTNFIPYLKRSY
jgi:hypothetical protein